MGLFGFGKKKKQDQDEASKVAAQTDQAAIADADETLDEAVVNESLNNADMEMMDGDAPTVSVEYEGRGEIVGPWDVEDDNVPDYDEYLSLGSYYLPFVQKMSLRIKANRATREVLGSTMTLGASSVEVEAFAAPKTLGLWEDVRADLLEANPQAQEVQGVFGTEVMLPVTVKNGKTVMTRIVGVDGPRWMLRGIFSGNAATDPDAEETKTLNEFFANIVVERGEAPLAPRDLIPMSAPMTPNERRAAAQGTDNAAGSSPLNDTDPLKGPLSSDHETEVKTTLSRGPMFSELR